MDVLLKNRGENKCSKVATSPEAMITEKGGREEGSKRGKYVQRGGKRECVALHLSAECRRRVQMTTPGGVKYSLGEHHNQREEGQSRQKKEKREKEKSDESVKRERHGCRGRKKRRACHIRKKSG